MKVKLKSLHGFSTLDVRNAALGVKLHEADPSHCFSMIFIVKQPSREAVKAFSGSKIRIYIGTKTFTLVGFHVLHTPPPSGFSVAGTGISIAATVLSIPGLGLEKRNRNEKQAATQQSTRENLLLFSWHCVRFALLLHHNCAERQNLRKFANLIEQSKQIHKLITYDET